MLAMAISLPKMVASMLMLAISLLRKVASKHASNGHQFLPWMVVNMPVLAISFVWDCGQHAIVGHPFYLGWWPACW